MICISAAKLSTGRTIPCGFKPLYTNFKRGFDSLHPLHSHKYPIESRSFANFAPVRMKK